MPAHVFDYAIVRVVPRVERGEFINVGVVMHCPTQGYLGCRIVLDRERLCALDPHADVDAIARHLDAFHRVCEGDPTAGAMAALPARERFHWLVAPRSTVIQTSPVHAGLADDPERALTRLVDQLVLPPTVTRS
jgi:hypothetical protein